MLSPCFKVIKKSDNKTQVSLFCELEHNVHIILSIYLLINVLISSIYLSRERITRVIHMLADEQKEVQLMTQGNIAVAVGLKHVCYTLSIHYLIIVLNIHPLFVKYSSIVTPLSMNIHPLLLHCPWIFIHWPWIFIHPLLLH